MQGASALSSARRVEFVHQPRLRELPVPHDRLGRDAQRFGHFFDGQASEEPQLNDVTFPRFEPRQRLERVVESHQIMAPFRDQELIRQRHAYRPTASFLPGAGSGQLHQNAAHQPRAHRQKVGPILPIDPLHPDQPEVGLVYQRGRLNAMAGPLAAHAPARNPLQLLMHEGGESGERPFVTLPPRMKELRHTGWSGHAAFYAWQTAESVGAGRRRNPKARYPMPRLPSRIRMTRHCTMAYRLCLRSTAYDA